MKRYSIYTYLDYDTPSGLPDSGYNADPESDGDWVKYDEAQAAIDALVKERDEAKRDLQIFLGKSNTLRSDLAADVRRLTTERDEALAACRMHRRVVDQRLDAE